MLRIEYKKQNRKRGDPYVIPFDEELLHYRKEDSVCNGKNEAPDDVELCWFRTSRCVRPGDTGVDQGSAHDGMFTEDDPVLPEQSTELAKEQAGHWVAQTSVSLVNMGIRMCGGRLIKPSVVPMLSLVIRAKALIRKIPSQFPQAWKRLDQYKSHGARHCFDGLIIPSTPDSQQQTLGSALKCTETTETTPSLLSVGERKWYVVKTMHFIPLRILSTDEAPGERIGALP